jgi:hypothetical protein
MRYRVGQEPAYDLKRFLVSACKEVGLDDIDAYMSLQPDNSRRVEVQAQRQDWPSETIQVQVSAIIGVAGSWPETADILAIAPLPGERRMIIYIPMLIRDVSLDQLVPALQEAVEQQAEIIGRRQQGETGPWVFGETKWRVLADEPDLGADLLED